MKTFTNPVKQSIVPARRACLAMLLFSVALVLPVLPASAQAPAPDSPAIEAQAHQMLSKLTLEQKIQLIGGVDSMFTYAEPSIDLPRLKMSDASVGVRTWGPTTAYAGGVALAATWDPNFAYDLGRALGRDARARGVNFLLGPGVNIARSPVAGRNFEYLSEDPYLNSTLVVPWIDGVQSQGVSATVKHYALNNQEYNRHNVDVTADERTMREIYLPAFKAAVTRGHVGAVMDSYNLVNGQHSTQNHFLNVQLLKEEWGFKGVLMSDWDATYDGVAAANNGLDLEMPSARFMNAATLMPAIKSGEVKEATIDDKVLRILRTAIRFHFLDRPQLDLNDPVYSVADRAVALRGALESMTLLKNQDHLLPLDQGKIKTIAVIGPEAWPAVPGGGGSSEATAFDPVSFVTGIGNFLGPHVHVLYTRGLPEMNEVFYETHWDGPVRQATYPSHDFTGSPATETVRGIANYKNEWWGPPNKSPRSIRYTASYKATDAGDYLILAAASGGDHYTIKVDGKTVAAQTQKEGQHPESATVHLDAGQTIQVEADYLPSFAGNRFALGIRSTASLISPDVATIAKAADAVVVAVGFGPSNESEGSDRSFQLPWGQDALIQAAAAANPHTIVTLTGGGAVDTSGWLDKVPALLHTWYPGQEGGTALAEILFGRHDPEGRLPITFVASWKGSPSYEYYYPTPGADTKLEVHEYGHPTRTDVIQHTTYGDKLMVGYRYYTTTGKQPLFPFGFGLSYTTFSFSNLQAPSLTTIGTIDPVGIPVSFDVTNTGSVDGAEVAELYVSDPSATVSRPERELKGFAKVRLAPGQTKHVTLVLKAHAFSYWSPTLHQWHIDPGDFILRVGSSSQDTPLTHTITLK
ncbi:MAG TPA: glycoside hydrolase family 3 C-terminal domain-containing protein [Terracidiphilus sp.]|nr:glycoside hydrolase family 3 C-terminal domain-containing protein [Terracidiphilus sp.]